MGEGKGAGPGERKASSPSTTLDKHAWSRDRWFGVDQIGCVGEELVGAGEDAGAEGRGDEVCCCRGEDGVDFLGGERIYRGVWLRDWDWWESG